MAECEAAGAVRDAGQTAEPVIHLRCSAHMGFFMVSSVDLWTGVRKSAIFVFDRLEFFGFYAT
jgi:hypothetical protein